MHIHAAVVIHWTAAVVIHRTCHGKNYNTSFLILLSSTLVWPPEEAKVSTTKMSTAASRPEIALISICIVYLLLLLLLLLPSILIVGIGRIVADVECKIQVEKILGSFL